MAAAVTVSSSGVAPLTGKWEYISPMVRAPLTEAQAATKARLVAELAGSAADDGFIMRNLWAHGHDYEKALANARVRQWQQRR